jgi:hypothetical protein
VRSGTTWTQEAYLKPQGVGTTQAGDHIGQSVASSGHTVIVGAPLEDSSTIGENSTANELAGDAGASYVFVRVGTTWTQQAYLKPAAVGTTQAGDQFGSSVAVSGDTVMVGAPFEDSNTTGASSTPSDTSGSSFKGGAAYVFTRTAGVWTLGSFSHTSMISRSLASSPPTCSNACASVRRRNFPDFFSLATRYLMPLALSICA